MGRKRRAKRARAREKKRARESGAPPSGAPPAEASQGPNRLGVVVAVIGLAALAVAIAFVGRQEAEPEPPAVVEPEPVEDASALDRWRAAPEHEIDVDASSFAHGPEGAPVTIVEFSDFECPYCREASRALASLTEDYEGRVRLVFKDFPLDPACNPYMNQPMHPFACRAAALARCAGAEDAFWSAHDALFALDALDAAALDEIPSRLGLDEEALASCLESEETLARIRAHVDEGRGLDVGGTPAIFVNGRRVPGYRAEDLRSIVDHILSSS